MCASVQVVPQTESDRIPRKPTLRHTAQDTCLRARLIPTLPIPFPVISPGRDIAWRPQANKPPFHAAHVVTCHTQPREFRSNQPLTSPLAHRQRRTLCPAGAFSSCSWRTQRELNRRGCKGWRPPCIFIGIVRLRAGTQLWGSVSSGFWLRMDPWCSMCRGRRELGLAGEDVVSNRSIDL